MSRAPAIASRLVRELVRADLRTLVVVKYFKIDGKVAAGQFRTRMCAICGQRSRDSVLISVETGLWHDTVCGASGDIFALIAGYANIDVRRDFRAVLELAAEISGHIPPTDPIESERRKRERLQIEAERRVEREADAKARDEEAKFKAGAEWKRLALNGGNQVGRKYLRQRGLDDRRLVGEDYVRFTAAGDVCVPLWNFDGELINVVKRVINPAPEAPKVVGLYGCPTSGSLVGRVQDIQRGDVMLVEGVADALTAVHLWPDRVVVGAHGAGRIPNVAKAAAPRIKTAGGRLVIVPDADDTGQAWALKAGLAACESGLVIDQTLIVVDVAPHGDLNAAHLAGWKP